MTEEKKMTNEEIAESILGCCSCREDWAKRDMRDPECQWCENGDLIVEALDEKDKEIARLRTQVNPLYQDLAGRLIGHIMENSDNHDIELALLEIINSAKKSRTEVLRLNGLLERRTLALKQIVSEADGCNCGDQRNDLSWPSCIQVARQALQDDGKGER